MSENWTRADMVERFGERGADAMKKWSDCIAELEQTQAQLQAVTAERDEAVKWSIAVELKINSLLAAVERHREEHEEPFHAADRLLWAVLDQVRGEG